VGRRSEKPAAVCERINLFAKLPEAKRNGT